MQSCNLEITRISLKCVTQNEDKRTEVKQFTDKLLNLNYYLVQTK